MNHLLNAIRDIASRIARAFATLVLFVAVVLLVAVLAIVLVIPIAIRVAAFLFWCVATWFQFVALRELYAQYQDDLGALLTAAGLSLFSVALPVPLFEGGDEAKVWGGFVVGGMLALAIRAVAEYARQVGGLGLYVNLIPVVVAVVFVVMAAVSGRKQNVWTEAEN